MGCTMDEWSQAAQPVQTLNQDSRGRTKANTGGASAPFATPSFGWASPTYKWTTAEVRPGPSVQSVEFRQIEPARQPSV